MEWGKSRNRVNEFVIHPDVNLFKTRYLQEEKKEGEIFIFPCNEESEEPFRTPQFCSLSRHTASFSTLWEQRSHSDRCSTAREMLQKNWWSFTADTLVCDSKVSGRVLQRGLGEMNAKIIMTLSLWITRWNRFKTNCYTLLKSWNVYNRMYKRETKFSVFV